MKAHIGVDAKSGLVHGLVGTAANVADVTQVDLLLHGEETYVCGDAAYTGGKRPGITPCVIKTVASYAAVADRFHSPAESASA